MLTRFKDFVAEQHLFSPEQEVLLAVSGGRDSAVMADLMQRSGYRFAMAHCNFHLRPGDCDRDQRFVADMAARYGVPFHTVDFDTAGHASSHGQSIEQAARELRYEWFADLCTEHGYACLATAHHRDDSIESFFLNLFRGTGIEGLHGIQPSSTLRYGTFSLSVVRPMLCFSRADIDAYVEDRGLGYVDDYTNGLLDARRNRIRLQLMPLLRELYPSVDATLQADIERFADAGNVYRTYVDDLASRMIHPYTPTLPTVHFPISYINVEDVRTLSPQRTLLFELLRPFGFNAATTADILVAMQHATSGKLFRSSTHLAELHRGHLLVAPDVAPVAPSLPSADGTLRLWQDGDRFRPFGMKGTRLVGDFLRDCGLSRIERRHVWVLTDDGGRITQVVGLRADECTRR